MEQTPLPKPVQRAVRFAATVHGLPREAVTLLSYEPVDWPDAALGAPQPDRLYAQVVTPGYRVTVSVAGKPVIYHTDRAGRVVRAPETPSPPR